MKKRLTFKCWKCQKTYTLLREITNEQVLIVACPYCNAEAKAKLDSYRNKPITVLKGDGGKEQPPGLELQLPDIIPTQKPD